MRRYRPLACSAAARSHLDWSGGRPELDALDDLLAAARDGHSGVLLLRGEAGIGKSVLLDVVAARAQGFDLARVAGVESEMELPYAGLQQLCRPFVDRVPLLPAPLRAALATAFGLGVGPPPDRFLVGLAVLQLLAGLAEEQPVLWIVDASTAPPVGEVPRAIDLVLDALAARLTEGYVAAAPMLTRALAAVATLEVGPTDVDRVLWLAGDRHPCSSPIATSLFAFGSTGTRDRLHAFRTASISR